MNYFELKNEQAPMKDCFFAFSDKQFAEGLEKNNLKQEDIQRGPYGLFGTKEGIKAFYDFYEKLSDRIAKECIPQDVYNYEFDNHECDYVGDDAEAIRIVVDYFDKEKAKKVNRKYGYLKI